MFHVKVFCVFHKVARVWSTHSIHLRGKEKEDMSCYLTAFNGVRRQFGDLLARDHHFRFFRSHCYKIPPTNTCWLLLTESLCGAQQSLGDRVQLLCQVMEVAFSTQSPSSPCMLSPNGGFGCLACSPRYLHMPSNIDPEKLSMVTSTSSKQSLVQITESY